MISALVSSLVQVAVVLAITLIIYLIFRRRSGSFWSYVGLTGTTRLAAILGLALGGAFAAGLLLMPGVIELATGPNTVVGKAVAGGVGPETAVILGAYALIQTSLSEEILFRGLIGKRLMNRFGFLVGDLMQATLFGALHVALFAQLAAPTTLAWIFVWSTSFGALAGLLKEKVGRGSILPGWIAHGGGNFAAYLALAYGWI